MMPRGSFLVESSYFMSSTSQWLLLTLMLGSSIYLLKDVLTAGGVGLQSKHFPVHSLMDGGLQAANSTGMLKVQPSTSQLSNKALANALSNELYSSFHLSLKPPLPHSICELRSEISGRRS